MIFNLVGTVLLFYSFQATSSNLKIVTAPDTSVPGQTGEQTALCAYGNTLFTASNANKGYWEIGMRPCPNWEKARATAVVNIEHPTFEGLGFVLLLAGFLLQYLSVPQPQTIADVRKQLRLLKEQDRLARRQP